MEASRVFDETESHRPNLRLIQGGLGEVALTQEVLSLPGFVVHEGNLIDDILPISIEANGIEVLSGELYFMDNGHEVEVEDLVESGDDLAGAYGSLVNHLVANTWLNEIYSYHPTKEVLEAQKLFVPTGWTSQLKEYPKSHTFGLIITRQDPTIYH